MTNEEIFCKAISSYYGEQITSKKQLSQINFSKGANDIDDLIGLCDLYSQIKTSLQSENSVGVSDATTEDGALARDREWNESGENADSSIASEHVPIGNRISDENGFHGSCDHMPTVKYCANCKSWLT